MNTQEILQTVQAIVRRLLKNDDVVLSPETTNNDIDGWDSLMHMLIIAEIEKQFSIRIGFRELMRIGNVGELVQTIENKIR